MSRSSERGSALVMAVFVLVIITTIGVALLGLSRNEATSAQATVSSKQAFYVSEGGLEDGRMTLFDINRVSPDPQDLSEELATIAGGDGVLDFVQASLTPTWDSDGNLTGFTGLNDDSPLRGVTPFEDGWYAAFMTNDPVDGITSTTDTNDAVMITSAAYRRDGSREIVQAVVFRPDTFAPLPATITLLGPTPTFNGGSSNAKTYSGNDYGSHCPGGTGASVPTIAVTGSAAVSSVGPGMVKPLTYESGSDTGLATLDDLTDGVGPVGDPLWTDCEALVELAAIIRDSADLVGNTSTPQSSLGVPGAPKVVYIDGDYDLGGNWDGAGLLLVTGDFELDGRTGFQGPIWVLGTGHFTRDGTGNGEVSGGIVSANVAGPDEILFTADDCTGDDGIAGTSDDGVASGYYDVNGAGNSTTGYCSAYINPFQSLRPYRITSFRQD